MKMTYEKILIRHQQLLDIGNLHLPRPVHVAIARNIVKMEAEIEVMNSQRKEIVDRFVAKDDKDEAKVDENRNYVFDSEEQKDGFLKEMNELNEVEVEVDLIKIKGEDLDRCFEQGSGYDSITPVQEAKLNWMIEY